MPRNTKENYPITPKIWELIRKVEDEKSTDSPLNAAGLVPPPADIEEGQMSDAQKALWEIFMDDSHSDAFEQVGQEYLEEKYEELAFSEEEKEAEEQIEFENIMASLSGSSQFVTGKKWVNHIKNQEITASRIYKASTLIMLKNAVKDAIAAGTSIRMVGSGHSFSNILKLSQTGYLVLPTKLNNVLSPGQPFVLLKKNNNSYPLLRYPNATNLVEVQSGISLSRLNRKLNRKGLALKTMGAYDAQTIIGAISTSTHGSRHDMGPIPDMVRSLLIVTGDGQIMRIEPAVLNSRSENLNGITNKAAFDAEYGQGRHPIILKQDDDLFRSVLVSMGSMGLIYSLVLEVDQANKLEESRKESWLNTELDELEANLSQYLSKDRTIDYNLLVNPYAQNNRHYCIVTRRMRTNKTTIRTKSEGKRNWKLLIGTGSLMLGMIAKGCLVKANKWQRIRKLLNKALRAMRDKNNYLNRSYRVFLTPRPKNIKGLALEVTLPVRELRPAAEYLFSIIKDLRSSSNKMYITAPISIRFVGESTAFLSQFGPYPTGHPDAGTNLFVCFEIPFLLKTNKWEQTVIEIREKMQAKFPKNLRIHWGLNFGNLKKNNYDIQSLFQGADAWLNSYRQLNPNKTFSNQFTQEMGFDDPVPPRGPNP